MKKEFLTVCAAAVMFAACGDDSSTSVNGDNGSSNKQKKGDSPYCVVKKTGDGAMQEIYEPGVGWGESGIRYNGSKAVSFVNQTWEEPTSKTKKKCIQLEDQSDQFDKGSFSCDSTGYSFTITIPKSQANDLDEIIQEMKDECIDLKEEWDETYKSSSSSVKEKSSSSSMAKFSSSSKDKSSSSITYYSSFPVEIGLDIVSSSSVPEIEQAIHDEDFDAMDLAPEPLVADENTLFFEDFDGKILCLSRKSSQKTGFSLSKDLPAGQLEFFFRPHEDFFNDDRALIGSDGARLLVYYDSGNLVLMMNKTNVFRYISEKVELRKDWNFVQVKWADDEAALYLNNEKVGEMELFGGYEASTRLGEQELVIGYKSDCCMSGAGKNSSMATSADFGPIKFSIPDTNP